MSANPSGRPRIWRLLTQRVVVSYHDDLSYEDDSGKRCGALGMTDCDEHTVQVALDQSQDTLAETELHELLHLVFAKAGLGLDHSDETQEAIVKRTAPILLSALRENPRLVERWLNRRILGKGSIL